MKTTNDTRMLVHIQPKIGDRIKMKTRYHRGESGEVVEVLTPPTDTHAITGLARYGVRLNGRPNIHDVSRHEFSRIAR